MGGIIRAEGSLSLAIGGFDDHVHNYLKLRPDTALSDLMRTGKARTSRWIHDMFPDMAAFA